MITSIYPGVYIQAETKCFQLVTKRNGQLRQLQLCLQPVPHLRFSNRDSPDPAYIKAIWTKMQNIYRTYTHTRLTALFPRLPGWAGTRKVKPIWILLKQETVSGSGISWTICKSAPRSRQMTMPATHHSFFLQVGCPSCHPTNSVKALKG